MPEGISGVDSLSVRSGISRRCLGSSIAGREQPAASWETEHFNAPDENEQQSSVLHFIGRLAVITHLLDRYPYLLDS